MGYFELYQENTSLYLIILLVSFIATIFVYGAFPLIFAKTTKKPITKKKYTRLCYGLNIIGMVCFIVLNGAVSGAPYLLWTWVFSNCGVKILKSRRLLSGYEQPNDLINDELETDSCKSVEESTVNFTQNSNVDIDKMTPQEAAEYLIADQLGEAYLPQNNQVEKSKTKVKYCSKCGSQIDHITKKCTGCGKQYFKGIKLNKYSVPIIILSVVLLVSVIFNVYLYREIEYFSGRETYLEEQVENLNQEIEDLNKEISLRDIEAWSKERKLEFFEDYAVIVSRGSRKYHKYGCEDLDTSYFWIYNVDAAEDNGYYACSKCN